MDPYTQFTIPEHTRRQYADAFQAAVQQENAKLANVSIVESRWTAKQYVAKQSDVMRWVVNNTRFGNTSATEWTGGFRSGFMKNLEMEPKKFDRNDGKLLDDIALPTGDVLTNAMYALNRLKDDLFIEAATAGSLGGAEPHITLTAFPSGNIIPVNYVKPTVALGASNRGLTVWKVLEARNRFLKSDVDFDREEAILAISPDMETQLMLDAEAASNNSWAKMVLEWFKMRLTGNLESKLLGVFRVITTNRLTTDSGTGIETAVAFCKRAFLSSPMTGMESHIDILPTQRHAIQVTAYGNWGCFRALDNLVLQVPCDPAP